MIAQRVSSHLTIYVNRFSFLGCVPSMLSHEEGYHLKGIPYQPTNISNTNQSACPLELQDTHIKNVLPEKNRFMDSRLTVLVATMRNRHTDVRV